MADDNQRVETKPYTDEDWREGLLARLRTLMVGVLILGGLTTTVGARAEGMRVFGIIMMFISLALIVILTSKRLPVFIRSLASVVAFGGAAFVSYFFAGFLSGPAVAAALSVILAALLIGKRALIVTIVIFATLHLSLGTAVGLGVWDGPQAADLNPSDPVIWFRTGFTALVIWAGIGFSVLFVVRTVERNLNRRQAALAEKDEALAQLQTEIAERQSAEKARREAELLATQAQKLDAIGRLAAGIAHDFNNALLVVQGWNDMRSETDETDDDRDATRSIEQAVQQGAYLSKQLLAFARKDVRTPHYMSIDNLVNELANTLRRLLRAGIELRVNARSGASVFADEAQLQQVLLNLVINARDALPEGGNIDIKVRKSGAPEGGSDHDDWVVIEVRDDGVGMDEQVRGLAFEPFFTTKTRSQGTGLGLSTVFGIVKQSDGEVEIDSTPDHGTTVSVFLPAAEESQAEADTPAEPDAERVIDARVLVLEDDPLALKLIVRSLERSGMSVVAAIDGDDALVAIADSDDVFDMLCSDAVFPGASLREVIAAFEQQSPDAGILICSGYVREELAIKGVESGAYEFLAKPFTRKDLIEKVEATLAASQPDET
ncbi:MAG: ATP-binding protein [Woeseiaceae bacterium]|nr:ATP-binding protein [Woeseiaceae bacterium]